MTGKTIIVLGGGVGGLVAANELRLKLPRIHRIIVVEKNHEHAFAPSFLWLMTGDRKPERITRPVHSLVRSGVDIVTAEVTNIDLSQRLIRTGAESFTFDYLVIALGSELAPELIPGLSECAYSFFSLNEAVRLERALSNFNGGKVISVVCSLPYKCPGAPHEGVMLMADHFRRRGIRDKVDIHLYTPEVQPMPVAGPQLGEAVKQMLTSKAISFHPSHKIVSVNSKTHEVLFEGKEPVHFDLLVAIPPHRAPGVARQAGLTDEAGWIPVDRSTLKTRHENVYAIGDITAISIPRSLEA